MAQLPVLLLLISTMAAQRACLKLGKNTLRVLDRPVNTGILGYQQLKLGFLAAETLRVWLYIGLIRLPVKNHSLTVALLLSLILQSG